MVADEMAKEKRYNEELSKNAARHQRLRSAQTQNTWTTSTSTDVAMAGELVGRVALGSPDASLDGARDFYIGTAYLDGGDFKVFSWTAKVACTYYRKAAEHHELCENVVGVRVLAHQGGRIVDYQDETFGPEQVAELFPERRLQIPRAPFAKGRARGVGASTPDIDHSAKIVEVAPGPESARVSRGLVPGPVLRAPDLLRRQLAAPKTAAMSAVLATLQSDQYEAITRPARENQILQGHPGTGKTIVAAHRAAYLLSKDVAPISGKVLVLGPTVEYVKHVQGALRALIADDSQYEVKPIPTLLEELAGLPRSDMPTESFVLQDVDQSLARLIDAAYSRARAGLDDVGEKATASDVYAELRWFLEDPPANGLEAEWVRYLRELPTTFERLQASRITSYRGLMAYIGVRTTRVENPGHVIVDEAQDIHPIEWEVLGWLGNRGGWTILGDMNQRRTDHTFGSWKEVANLLAIEDSDGQAPVEILARGYRSTAQILRFANQLLPARDRHLYSLQQDGEEPTVTRAVSLRELPELTLSRATKLLARVGAGTVAIITVEPLAVQAALVRRGWQADFGDASTWRSGGQTLTLFPPERARGLEFDGVVVVEPAAFPENVGRQGVLYTALTRANRLLTVVHSRPLPRGLRVRA
ncbi:hypothetical protein BKA24_002702 [Microbacterium marinum]|uniref:UvrD-like helicase ATP-binding domain-containing protein n=1 Tax=Microbacterium marinum TaxID=421115 RepID=A0A7W7BSG0_9MICO|nr:hypothetical protein [Microbacterium marinum]